MANTQLLTQNEFINRCKNIHGQELSYEKTIYKNTRSNVTVTCSIHGDFTRNARALLKGTGCPDCNKNWKNYVNRQRMTTDEFVTKAIDIHEGFYSYEFTNYKNSRSLVTITCPVHGNFSQCAGGHLEGYGCKKCGDKKHGDYRPWFIKTYFDRFPEKINLPATLYLLYSAEEDFYKIGITTKDRVEDRLKYMHHYKFIIVDKLKDTLYNVSVAEQKILSEVKKYKPNIRFGGYSECFKEFIDITKYLHEEGR